MWFCEKKSIILLRIYNYERGIERENHNKNEKKKLSEKSSIGLYFSLLFCDVSPLCLVFNFVPILLVFAVYYFILYSMNR